MIVRLGVSDVTWIVKNTSEKRGNTIYCNPTYEKKKVMMDILVVENGK